MFLYKKDCDILVPKNKWFGQLEKQVANFDGTNSINKLEYEVVSSTTFFVFIFCLNV